MAQGGSPRRNDYGQPSRTKRGEMVKSLGEKQIADYFYANGIKYVYEDQAKTDSSAFRNRISRPDFFLPEYDVYVEYWGMIDVGDTQQRNRYRKDMDWKIHKYFDNHIRFISIYPWHLSDLDGAFKAQYKKVMKRDFVIGAVSPKTVFALPLSSNFKEVILSRVPSKLMLTSLELEYNPYYFVEYDCFSQSNVFYERVNLSSHGTVVIDARNGSIADYFLQSGVSPAIASSGRFADCARLRQRELPRSGVAPGEVFAKFGAAPVSIQKYDAERIVGVEVAKNLSQTYTRTYRNGRVSTKTVRPYSNEVRIVSDNLVNIPMLTAVYQFKRATYRRVMQASTNQVIADEVLYCNVATNRHFSDRLLVCDECGNIACRDHGKICAVCGRGLCLNHISSRGLVLKKYYCAEHLP